MLKLVAKAGTRESTEATVAAALWLTSGFGASGIISVTANGMYGE